MTKAHGVAMSDPSQRPGPASPPSSPRSLGPRGPSQHAPLVPSRLRETVASSPVDSMAQSQPGEQQNETRTSPLSSPNPYPESSHPLTAEPDPIEEGIEVKVQGDMLDPTKREADARTRLLEDYHRGAACGSRNCDHGTFSPKVRSHQNSVSSVNNSGGRHSGSIAGDGDVADIGHGIFGDTFADGLMGGGSRDTSMSTTKKLANKYGVKNQRLM